MVEDDTRHTSRSLNLLISLCNSDPVAHDPNILADCAETDWDQLLSLAAMHHVSPLLYRGLQQVSGATDLLSEIQQVTLRQTCRNIKFNNLRVEAELTRISEIFDAHGIPHIVFKGPALARLAFGDLGLRQFNDFDLLIPYREIDRIVDILGKTGYTSIVPLNSIQNQKLRHFEKEITLVRPEEGRRRFEADLHWMFLRPALSVPLGFEDLHDQTVVMHLGSKEISILNPTYAFIACCIHNGGNEVWHNLKQLADLDACLRTFGPEVNWHHVVDIAQKHDLIKLIGIALRLSQAVFDTPIPAGATALLAKVGEDNAIVSKLSGFIYPEQPSRWRAIRVHMSMRDRLITRLRILCKSILESLSPNFADEEFLHLPNAGRFFAFYYLVRPLRVMFSGRNRDRF